VKIHTYSKDACKNYKLTINANSIDLLADAAWQVQSIERIYEKQKRERMEARERERMEARERERNKNKANNK
jgi:hypothetical protein